MSANPFGAMPRPGWRPETHSGAADVKAGPNPTQVFRVNLADIVPEGYAGMATIHVSARDISIIPPGDGEVPNSVLMGELTWQSGRGTGREILDLTRGHMLQVGGTSCIGLACWLISAIEGVDLVPWATKRVEATINWFGAADKPGTTTMPMVTLAEEGTSAFQAIPLQARDHMVVTDAAAAADLDTLVAEFSTTDDPAGTGILYRTWNPFVNGTPIVLGVNFVRYTSAAAMRVGSVYDLW